MPRRLNYMPPSGPVNAYRSYSVNSPPRTHWRPATCAEYQCEEFRFGFTTTLDLATELGQKLYKTIKNDRTRSAIEIRTGMYEVKFDYPPGTPCWQSGRHRVPLERPPILIVRGGDWRGSTGLIRRHTRIEYWVEDMAENQQSLAELQRRG